MIDNVVEHLFIKGEPGHALFAKIGSGKTLASLEVISRLRDLGEVKRVLVVAPLRVLSRTWPDEIRKYGYNFTHEKVNGKPLDSRSKSDIVFCSPDSLHKVIAAAEGKIFDLLIVDESQRFQNFTTLRMKNLKKILPHVSKRLILTATPAANRLTQLFSQIYIIDDGISLGKNVTVCRSKFTTRGGFKGREFIFDKDKEKVIADAISPIVTYINEADIDVDYPKRIINDIICPMDDVTRRHEHTLKQELFVALQNGEKLTVGNAAAAYNSLRQLSGGFLYDEHKVAHHIHNAKLDALESIANESTGPVLIFYWFTENLERIVKKFGADNCAIPKGKNADAEITKWMDGKKQFMPSQIASMSAGLNLQASNHDSLVLYDIPESGTDQEQGIGRLLRPGGAPHVFVHRLLLESSLDFKIVDRVEGRLNTQESFLDALKSWAAT